MEGVSFRDVQVSTSIGRMAELERRMGRWLTVHGHRVLRKVLWQVLGEPRTAASAVTECSVVREYDPDLVVSTHVAAIHGRGFVAVARRAGIPTVGNMTSWDNMFRALRVRTDRITCWSEQNKEDTVRLCGYRPEEVVVTGAPAFDAYFATDGIWSREQLCSVMGLDPGRPIVLFASLGQMNLIMDETSTFEVLLELVDQGRINGNPQIVLRLHPLSRDPYFSHLMQHPAVVPSRYLGYLPWMGWAPWREDVILAGNLLRHADVCVSPGSTMTVEAAIFDTPVVMPVLNEYQHERYVEFISRQWLDAHFKPLVVRGLVPLAYTKEEYADMINRALSDRGWFRAERAEIKTMLLGPLDGRSTERFAGAILGMAV